MSKLIKPQGFSTRPWHKMFVKTAKWVGCKHRLISLYPHHKMWGGGKYWIRFVASVGRSVGRSVSNSCPLYKPFTNGRISLDVQSPCCLCVSSRSRSQLKVKYLTNYSAPKILSPIRSFVNSLFVLEKIWGI